MCLWVDPSVGFVYHLWGPSSLMLWGRDKCLFCGASTAPLIFLLGGENMFGESPLLSHLSEPNNLLTNYILFTIWSHSAFVGLAQNTFHKWFIHLFQYILSFFYKYIWYWVDIERECTIIYLFHQKVLNTLIGIGVTM